MSSHPLPLSGLRVLSLALNLPGPAALMRCRALGADCLKLEPPSGDPMRLYSPQAYAQLHEGIPTQAVDLKTPQGLERLDEALASCDVLLSSFRPSAMARLCLDWESLHARHPALSLVAIVGAPGPLAEIPGHDLTYQAEQELVTGLALPASLYADMGGALMAVQAVLQAALSRGHGQYLEVALSDAAAFLALPRYWGLTAPEGMVGGAHAGYQVYACANGRVAVAALEPHFARTLCEVAGVPAGNAAVMLETHTQAALAKFFAACTREQLDQLARTNDLPLHTLAP